jgi:colanic acid biosynthesis glycosyl transferase WcaI
MRILIHGVNYSPELIGIGRYTGKLGSWLANRGHQVTVLAAPPYYPQWHIPSSYRGKGWWREWINGVEVLRAPLYVPAKVTGKKRLLHELSFGASCLFWWPYLFRRRWDVVLAICPLLQSGIFPALLSYYRKIPFIFHFQDLQLDMAREMGIINNSLLLILIKQLEQYLLSNAEAVTTISQAMSVKLKNKGVSTNRLYLFPNWADLEQICPSNSFNTLRREIGLENTITILYSGNIAEKQGIEIILEAAKITKQNNRIRFIIAGEGAARIRLQSLAKKQNLDNLIFKPIQSEKRFPLLLAAGDIHLVVQKAKAADLVMPSKLVNILAAGRPFIATAQPQTELGKVTQESQAGLLVPPEDASALAQAILKLSEYDDLRKQMGDRARKYAESHLNREIILRQFESLLDQLVHNKSCKQEKMV